ncbi:MAG: hypothetical protein HKO99_08365 [Xanthomonadales bacterium]|nr:hypothetical protein [Gammaproteobacteria bacterium]NNK51594.1 hypothetical protein [Xanthomonadales bacterium]
MIFNRLVSLRAWGTDRLDEAPPQTLPPGTAFHPALFAGNSEIENHPLTPS